MMTTKINVGTDIIEVQRFRKKPLEKNQSFYKSLFTKSELMHCVKYKDPYPHFAGIFAAKESIIKCLKEAPSKMTDIELFWNKDGRPFATISTQKICDVNISISHTRTIALAVVIIL